MMRLQARGHQCQAAHGSVSAVREGPATWRRAKPITAPTSRGRSPPLPSRVLASELPREVQGELTRTGEVRFGGGGLCPHARCPSPPLVLPAEGAPSPRESEALKTRVAWGADEVLACNGKNYSLSERRFRAQSPFIRWPFPTAK